MSGKVALITGSTSGIGLATAHKLAAKGCTIVLHGLAEPDVIEKTKAEIKR